MKFATNIMAMKSITITITALIFVLIMPSVSLTAEETNEVAMAGYNIYRCAGSGCTPTTLIATSAINYYSDTGLSANTAYTYRVSAYDAVPNTGGYSEIAEATTDAVLASSGNVYFYFDAEDGVVGEELPHHQSAGPNFCGPECGAPTAGRATYQSAGGAPQGN
ncbi:MAG: fibronectin type III domain-containing protein, partial [Candidatus Aenigmarchaeota archaeon]|nr:fibronectin type III domain-containing protein [Candidatus Aenigmarchaeota archaeon]